MWSPWAWVSRIRTIGAPRSAAWARIALALPFERGVDQREAVVLLDEEGVDHAVAADPGVALDGGNAHGRDANRRAVAATLDGGIRDRLAAMSPDSRNEVARSEKILPGVWRLRLPCPWPGRPARQRVGDLEGRRGRPLRHRHRRRGRPAPARARARPGQAEAARRPARRLHPLPQRPLRLRRPDPRRRRLRALDAPGVGAHQGDGRGSRRARSTTASRSPGTAASRRDARALRGPPRREPLHRPRRRARPRARRRRRRRHRPRLLPRLRDARATRRPTSSSTSPRAACSSPATTCSAASPSSTTTATPPTPPASSSSPSTSSTSSTSASACPATAAPSATSAPRSRRTARRSTRSSAASATRSRTARRRPSKSVEFLIGKENMTGPAAAWGTAALAQLPRPLSRRSGEADAGRRHRPTLPCGVWDSVATVPSILCANWQRQSQSKRQAPTRVPSPTFACPGSGRRTATSSRSTASTSRSAATSSSRCSARPARARRRCCGWSPVSSCPTRARSSSPAAT